MDLRTEMGSSYSTYLKQNCAPDLFHIVVEPGELIEVNNKYEKRPTVLVTHVYIWVNIQTELASGAPYTSK